jgi:GcrA cell cycle regulator
MRGEQDLWTDESIALLRKLWAEGVPASAIAVQLGGVFTRSAVLGKVHRMRLAGANVASSTKRRSKTVSPESDASDKSPFNDLPASPWRRRRGKQDEQSAAAKMPGKRLLELANDSCRWPLGDPGTARFRFCGATDAAVDLGIPYCPRHMRRAYLAPRRTRGKNKPSIVTAGEPVSDSPSVAPSRAYVWRARVRNPAARWR